jgi:hypothetical protein
MATAGRRALRLTFQHASVALATANLGSHPVGAACPPVNPRLPTARRVAPQACAQTVSQSVKSAATTSASPAPPLVPGAASSSLDVTLHAREALATPAFIDAVAGEWFGYEVAFAAADGTALEIEERYVPDEFRAWAVPVKGFEVVSSSRVVVVVDDDDDDIVDSVGNEGGRPRCSHRLVVKRTRALPSVGCEADAVVPEVRVDEWPALVASAAAPDGRLRVGVGFDDGGYFWGPAVLSADNRHCDTWTVCVADPRPAAGVPRRARLEIGRVNDRRGAIIAVVESWDGQFCNGAILPGCGGKNASFADETRIVPEEALVGEWTSASCSYEYCEDLSSWNKTVSSRGHFTRSTEQATAEADVAMPLGMSAGFRTFPDGNSKLHVGWLTSADHRGTVVVDFDQSGRLTCVVNAVESRIR